MSLSSFFQKPEVLDAIPGSSPEEIRELFLEKGEEWFNRNPEDRSLISENLKSMGLNSDKEMVNAVADHVILHYYEKILPLSCTPGFFAGFLKEHVEYEEAVERLRQAVSDGCGILMATSHFGGVEFIAPVLSLASLPVNPVLRFTTEGFSRKARDKAEALKASGHFSGINFVEIGRPGTQAALEMMAVLRRAEILLSVFDENTEYSTEVELFGRKVYGGAGLDRILKAASSDVKVFTFFMIRKETNKYQLELKEVQPDKEMVQRMFNNLEDVVRKYPEQWYYLHEEIPFVNKEGS
ncbi:MAG: lysophospholipid acyltransferase family protein [Chitinivibrionales bacterium]